MSNDLVFARQYLEGRLAETRGRPDLHTAVIETYTRYLKVLTETPDRYEAEAGDMFLVWKSESLDRQNNLRALAEKLSHREAAEAHAKMAQRVAASKNYAELAGLTVEIQDAGKKALALEIARRDALTALFSFLILVRAEPEKEKPGRRQQAKEAFAEIQRLDPDFTFAKIKTHLPYRAMTYYTDEHLRLLEATVAECI